MSDDQKTTFHIGGDVKSHNVVIDSTQIIHGDLTIVVRYMPAASEDVRETLQQQVAELLKKLEEHPTDKADEVQKVKVAAEDAVAEAEKEQPDKQRLEIRGENLKKAAENLAAVAPISVQIAKTLLLIG